MAILKIFSFENEKVFYVFKEVPRGLYRSIDQQDYLATTARVYTREFFGELIGQNYIKLYQVGERLFLLLQDDIPYVQSKSGLFVAVQRFFHVKFAISTDPEVYPELRSLVDQIGVIYGKYHALPHPVTREEVKPIKSQTKEDSSLPSFKSFVKGLYEDVPRSKIIYSFF